MAAYDTVVIGGGHNGLTTAAYLARAYTLASLHSSPIGPRAPIDMHNTTSNITR